jgi:hypothetical protein
MALFYSVVARPHTSNEPTITSPFTSTSKPWRQQTETGRETLTSANGQSLPSARLALLRRLNLPRVIGPLNQHKVVLH